MSAKRVKASPDSAVPQDVIAILESIIEERDRAMAKFGVQNHPDGTGGGAAAILRDQQIELVDKQAAEGKSTWRDILMEEVREAFAETDLVALDKELMQVQQVCLVWREDIHRRIIKASLRAEVDGLEAKVAEARPPTEQAIEAEMRRLAAKWISEPALRSLGNGGHPGRRWMLDNLRHVMIVVGGNDKEDLNRLETWVKGLPSSWWDVNDSEKWKEHDEQVSAALAAKGQEKSEYGDGWSAPF